MDAQQQQKLREQIKRLVRPATSPDAPAPPVAVAPRRRIPRWRLFLWITEALVLLACLEHFILRPRLNAAREQTRTAAAAIETVRGELIRPLGDAARLDHGLLESFPAYLPPPFAWPSGAIAMQEQQLATAAAHNLPVEVVNSIGMRFRLVPPGRGLIGSPEHEAGRGAQEVQHLKVFASPFYMGMFEVTQAQWKKIMGDASNPSQFHGDDLPVQEVSWYDCQKFLLELCRQEGVSERTYRLPSEAEWEYACRGGTLTAYCFGDDPRLLDQWADYSENNYRRPAPVGHKRANVLGLHDMHGNVWEWCRDYFSNYPGDFTPEGEQHLWRNIRGGNWYVGAAECRSANRCRLPGRSVGNMLGFRLIRTLE